MVVAETLEGSKARVVYVRYEDGDVAYSLRMTLPRRWLARGEKCSKLLQIFVDSFNAKHEKHRLSAAKCLLRGDRS